MPLAGADAAGDRRLRLGLGQPGGERGVKEIVLELFERAGAVDGELGEPEGERGG